MTFHKDKTIVEKMVLEDKTKFTLEHSIVIFYSHKSRDSSTIIDSQIKNVKTSKNQIYSNAQHEKILNCSKMQF